MKLFFNFLAMSDNIKRVFKLTFLYTLLYVGIAAIFTLIFSEDNLKANDIASYLPAFFMFLYAYDLVKEEDWEGLKIVFVLLLIFEILEKTLFWRYMS